MSIRTLAPAPLRLKLTAGGTIEVKHTDLGAIWQWLPGYGQKIVASYGGDWIRKNCVMYAPAARLADLCDALATNVRKPREEKRGRKPNYATIGEAA